MLPKESRKPARTVRQTVGPGPKPHPWEDHEDNITLAVSLAEGNLGRGIEWTILENLSTTMRTVVLPSVKGRAVPKSTEMSDQGQ